MANPKIIAVLCQPESRAAQLAARLRITDTQVTVCQSAHELCELSDTFRVDAVLIDHKLDDSVSGLDVLARLSRELVSPITILLGDLNAAENMQAAELRVSSVLSAASSEDAIATATLAAVAAKPHCIQIPQAARRLVRDGRMIPPLPQLIVRVAGFLDDPDASVARLAKEISADARITAELLKLINSASMGLSGKITRIQDAVHFIGVKRTVALVLSTHLSELGKTRGQWVNPDLDRKIRLRSLLMASTASTYAAMAGQACPETAYVLALLQDLGVLTLAQELGPKYQHILDCCSTTPRLQLVTCERRELGFTHADVSAALLRRWSLPPALTRLVQQHHDRSDSFTGSAEDLDLLQAMQVAEAMAEMRERPTRQHLLQLKRSAAMRGRMDEDGLRKCLSQAITQAAELGQIIGLPMPDEAEMQRLFERLATEAEVDLKAWKDTSASVSPGCRVVVLDDDETTLDLIEEWLKGTEFDVALATEPGQIWNNCLSADLIVCDLHLAETEGTDVIRKLQAAGADAPVLIMSSDRTRQSVLGSIGAGAYDYLPKPLTPDGLLTRLRRHLADMRGHPAAAEFSTAS